ncbi:MAG: sodium/solute symporter [Candidatus Marinimicrobia bacterium]|jgi:SSS family transporter|nr:sodium/solute symporter [Candidatus Neomarinimicrobiota bacterium]MBT4371768.1 sodium/solute symporter [Candidatus Neomarinimicrobiota bacterium]MBT4809053.1 sodium/solute symporter [Candidatus Neomarinimicrobiota bacterium]MBT5176724.1 sodium/solute symporter [Candidatus Neomarinimicrobiota bacterium]MBT6130158.1 sodium/solute symporter [Candidatus Neomarinimicrobiota bacterium]
MNKKIFIVFASVCSMLWATQSLAWNKLPDLPNPLGVAGPFVGIHNDVLILSGGANFPNGVPWEKTDDGFNSPKIYNDQIHVLIKNGNDYSWYNSPVTLPRSLAYGVSIPTINGIICIGGEWKNHEKNPKTKSYKTSSGISDKIFVIQWKDEIQISDKWFLPGEDENTIVDIPNLPQSTTAMAGAIIDNKIYIVGGDSEAGATHNFWMLDLNNRTSPENYKWQSLQAWNGAPRTHLLAVSQNDGREESLFIFSGRANINGQWQMLTDAHKYVPSRGEWESLGNIQVEGDLEPRCVMAGTVAKMGVNHLAVFGGADGKGFLYLTKLAEQISRAEVNGNQQEKDRIKKEQQQFLNNHHGFSNDILLYNTVTNRWSKYGDFPGSSHVTTSAIQWGESIIIPSGEISPGIRSPQIWEMKPMESKGGFGTLNWVVLGIYLIVLVGIGFWVSKRGKTTDDYFLAGRRIPWWAAGLSIYSTQLSAITYLAIPAKTFATDWVRFLIQLGIIACAPIVVYFFLPFFRRLNVTSAYEYLEMRFSLGIRLLGSSSFVIFQLARMGIVILLPALALSAVTGLDVVVCIIMMGILSTFYTVLGGIEAVIWTDVLQTGVLLGGAIVALFIIMMNIDGGLASALSHASEQGKLTWVNLDWNLKDDTLGVILLGAIFTVLLPYTTDQAVVQRYLTTADENQSAKAIYTNGILAIPGSILFFSLGTALFIYFQQFPSHLPPFDKADQVFPIFIVNELPAGLAGLLIAGVFAAAMSSLDSSMHSIATVLTTDFIQRLRPGQKNLLSIAKKITLVLGVMGTVSAIVIASTDVKHLWDYLMDIIGLLLGALGGLFMLGIFTKRVNAIHAWIGVTACVLSLWWVKNYTDLNGLLYGAIGTGSCFFIGYLASKLLPQKNRELKGLTWYTRDRI